MTNFNSIIKLATQAMCKLKFGEADAILQQGLGSCEDLEEKQIVLHHLAHLYEHPFNKDLDKAQMYMSESESLHPSAYTALANAYFQLYSKLDHHAARKWAEIASSRALEEHDMRTLYSASAVAGHLAAGDGDRVAATAALRQLETLLGSADETIVHGDAVEFLELLVKTDNDIAVQARWLAGFIAPKIEDADFRARAQAVAEFRSQ